MKKLFLLFLMLFLASCGNEKLANQGDSVKDTAAMDKTADRAEALKSILARSDAGIYRQGELLVKFKSGLLSAQSLRVHQTVGAAPLRKFAMLNVEHVELPPSLSIKDAIIKYMQEPSVEYAEPNYLRHAMSFKPMTVIPNDPFFGLQWGLWNTGASSGGTPGSDIRAAYAWNITTGNGDIVIAVIDTGVDYNHADLKGNIWTNPGETSCTDGTDHDGNGFINDCRGWNFVDNNNAPLDDSGHGSHVAGIIGAAGNNATGVAGVIWNVRLMALKILDSTGTGSIADEVAAINYVITMKKRGINIKAVNASFAGADFSNVELSAISAANDAGLLLAAAAGNGNESGAGTDNDLVPQYPANYNLPNIISVAATDQNDNLASFSNFGAHSVHTAAPGMNIISTVPPELQFAFCLKSPDPAYDYCSGTSMSTPFVSGLAGLLWTVYPNFSNIQVRSTILRYVDALPSLQGRVVTGGRINAFRAVSSLLPPGNLSAAPVSSGRIDLTWTDNATGEDGYKVYRQTGSGSFDSIATLGPDSTSFTDTSVHSGTSYTYRVIAFNSIPANSAFSNDASATTPGGEPSPTPPPKSGGGGGCSVGGKQNTISEAANTIVLFIPPLIIMARRVLRIRVRRR